MSDINDAVVQTHQVFSKSNLGVEIFYLDNGWAIKAPTEVSFEKINNKMFALINNIRFFIQSQFHPEITNIRHTKDESGSFLYYVLRGQNA